MGFEKNRAGKFPKNCKLKPNLKIQADGCLPAGAADLTNPGIASPRRHVFCSGCKCMNFIVTLFLQNHYFFEKQSIFSAFSRKTGPFFREYPDFFSVFPKNSPIFSPNAKKITNFDFSEFLGYFSLIFNYNSTTDGFPAPERRKCRRRQNPQNPRNTVIFLTISCYNSVINLYLYALFRNKKKHHSY